jgi:ArsR family transcriptional regulator, arsenate/arsenite/antimonite-responsive transcriptional repressor
MKQTTAAHVDRYAGMFAAMGGAARLRIVQLLLTAEPHGMVPGEILQELGIPGSTLSHHLEKLRTVGLVLVRREGTFLRYRACDQALQELLSFLYAECCTRNRVVQPTQIVTTAQIKRRKP